MSASPGPRPGLMPDGRKIRALRVERGITVTALARQISRHRQSLWNIEGQNTPISDVFASQIANALGVPVGDILMQGEPGDGNERAEVTAALETS